MSIVPLPPVSPAQAGAVARIMVIAALGFDENLPIGSSVEGRVVRQLEPGRYVAELNGRQVTVQVQQALIPGDTFAGRLIAAGDRPMLELTRMHPAIDAHAPVQAAPELLVLPGNSLDAFFRRAFETQNLTLEPDELTGLIAAARAPADSRQIVGAGLLLRRAGLRVTRERVQSVLDTISESRQAIFRSGAESLQFDLAASEATGRALPENAAFLSATADAIRDIVDLSAHLPGASDAFAAAQAGSSGQSADWQRHVWNLPFRDGTPHQAQTMHVHTGEREFWVDVVLQGGDDSGGSREQGFSQRAAMHLHLGALGSVQVDLRLSARHVRLAVHADSNAAVGFLTEETAALRSALLAEGWDVDELRYELSSPEERDCVRNALADRVLADCGMDRSA